MVLVVKGLQCLQRDALKAWKPLCMFGLNHLKCFSWPQKTVSKIWRPAPSSPLSVSWSLRYMRSVWALADMHSYTITFFLNLSDEDLHSALGQGPKWSKMSTRREEKERTLNAVYVEGQSRVKQTKELNSRCYFSLGRWPRRGIKFSYSPP